jgi:hypothetical protein
MNDAVTDEKTRYDEYEAMKCVSIFDCDLLHRSSGYSKAARAQLFYPPSLFNIMASSSLPLASKPSSSQMQARKKGKTVRHKPNLIEMQKKKKRKKKKQTANLYTPKVQFNLKSKQPTKHRKQSKEKHKVNKWYSSKTPCDALLKLTIWWNLADVEIKVIPAVFTATVTVTGIRHASSGGSAHRRPGQPSEVESWVSHV